VKTSGILEYAFIQFDWWNSENRSSFEEFYLQTYSKWTGRKNVLT
jgi:hypothetical protein